MPILEVEIVGDLDSPDRQRLARRIADAAGHVFGSPPGSTWVRLRFLASSDYAENDNSAAEPSLDEMTQPVFVAVTKAAIPSEDASFDSEVRLLTAAIAATCGRPVENVHVYYEPSAAGRIAFGGKRVSH